MLSVAYHPWQISMFHARGLYLCRTSRGVVLSDQLGDADEEDVLLSSMRPLFATDAIRRSDDDTFRIAFVDDLDELVRYFPDTTYDILVLDHLVFDQYLSGRRYCPARGVWLRVAPTGWSISGPPRSIWSALL